VKLSHSQAHAIRFLVALSFLLDGATFVVADHPDPTVPSPQIVKRLELDSESSKGQPTQSIVAKKLLLPRLRLKAIVLRDNDHGTALVSNGGSEVYLVKLRRTEINGTQRFIIGGLSLAVKDFSKSTLIMHNLQTDQHFIVN